MLTCFFINIVMKEKNFFFLAARWIKFLFIFASGWWWFMTSKTKFSFLFCYCHYYFMRKWSLRTFTIREIYLSPYQGYIPSIWVHRGNKKWNLIFIDTFKRPQRYIEKIFWFVSSFFDHNCAYKIWK